MEIKKPNRSFNNWDEIERQILYLTEHGGQSYTAGDGIDIDCTELKVKNGANVEFDADGKVTVPLKTINSEQLSGTGDLIIKYTETLLYNEANSGVGDDTTPNFSGIIPNFNDYNAFRIVLSFGTADTMGGSPINTIISRETFYSSVAGIYCVAQSSSPALPRGQYVYQLSWKAKDDTQPVGYFEIWSYRNIDFAVSNISTPATWERLQNLRLRIYGIK